MTHNTDVPKTARWADIHPLGPEAPFQHDEVRSPEAVNSVDILDVAICDICALEDESSAGLYLEERWCDHMQWGGPTRARRCSLCRVRSPPEPSCDLEFGVLQETYIDHLMEHFDLG